MLNDITIRQASLDDLDLLIHWRMEVLHCVFSIPGDADTAELRQQNLNYYRKALENGSHIACFAEEDGEIVGCGGLCLYDEMPSPDNPTGHCAYLMNIYVRPEHQGHGKLPIVLGGYSLGGLFSLWAGSESDCFTAIAAMSPSVWIAGWQDYARQHPVKTHSVYLSLGDREEHTRNKAIAQVGNNIRWEHEHLRQTLDSSHTMLEWNTGNHFVDGARRTAKGFAWCISRIQKDHILSNK